MTNRSLRRCVPALAFLFSLIWSQSAVRAQTVQQTTGPVRFSGQIAAVFGPATDPTGFSLQIPGGNALSFRIASTATFKAVSAEAEVEGLQVGDYAIVTARHTKVGWVANRIEFDTLPVEPARPVVEMGTITRVSANQLNFVLRLDSGELRLVRVNKRTKFRIDGQPDDTPPVLNRGMQVQVSMLRVNGHWVAVEVNLRTAGQPPHR